MQASHPRYRTRRYRLPASHTCELGAADNPALCPRLRKALRVFLPSLAGAPPGAAVRSQSISATV